MNLGSDVVITITGIVLVFAILVLLMLIIMLEGKIFDGMAAKKKAAKEPAAPKAAAKPAAPVQQAAPAPVVEEGIPGDVVAAIMAAIHAMGNGHLFPYRTQKLSPSAPMVLGWTRPGRVGRCRNPDREAWMRNLRASLFCGFGAKRRKGRGNYPLCLRPLTKSSTVFSNGKKQEKGKATSNK